MAEVLIDDIFVMPGERFSTDSSISPLLTDPRVI
jgi:hypothetical protein